MNIKNNMKSLSIVKTLVVLFYVGHNLSWALNLPATTGVNTIYFNADIDGVVDT